MPQETASLRQQVTDTLRESILSGSLRPGQKLIERELYEELLVSRTILREALQHLQAESMIVSTPRRGLSVAKPGAREANEMLRVRQALTPLVGEEFARNASDAQVARLREHVDRLDDQNPMTAENKFYSILLEGCGNSVASSMLTHLNNRIIILQHLSPSLVSHNADALDELRAIVSAIEARDAELTGQLCAAHVGKGAAGVRHELTS
ncbi:GntR family transcriptional regulator [Phyllobacterium sp. LjRoot231]|uniref:GntR family transcriptional regulator n=1 Tax=Phyllobacterium sp. LjRoot231 TaxID=3342289 RepID=UPI003ECC39AC